MNIDELSREDQVALVALVEALTLSDGEVSEGEQREIKRIASALGDEAYRALLDEVDRSVPDEASLKRLLQGIQDREVREVLFGTAFEEAMASPSVQHRRSELLDWLAEAWGIDVRPAQDENSGD